MRRFVRGLFTAERAVSEFVSLAFGTLVGWLLKQALDLPLGTAVVLGVVATCLLAAALIARQDRAHKQAALAGPAPIPLAAAAKTESPAQQVDSWVERGESLRQELQNPDLSPEMVQKRARGFYDDARTALVGISPLHIRVLDIWEEVPLPGPVAIPPLSDARIRKHFDWQLSNLAGALRDIAVRLRARAGEDVGPQSLRRSHVKDLLLKADVELRGLHDERASGESFAAWEAEFHRLLRQALTDGDFDRLVTQRHVEERESDLDETAGPVWATGRQVVPLLQMELDQVQLQESYHPNDWRGRWREWP